MICQVAGGKKEIMTCTNLSAKTGSLVRLFQKGIYDELSALEVVSTVGWSFYHVISIDNIGLSHVQKT